MHRKLMMFVLAGLLLGFASAAVAQVVTGTISGTVKDSSGAVVPNATVTITNTDKNITARTLKTDAAGGYSAPLLPVGQYAVKVEANGFATASQSNIALNVNENLAVNLTLQVGSSSQTVTVEAAPLQVDLQTAQAQTVITGTQIRELAINTRNYEQLVSLMPGVSTGLASDQLYVGVSNPLGTSNQINFSVNGGRPTQNTWNIDGADNVDRGANLTLLAYPSVDSIDEFSVQRGLYTAEYGRSSAGQINVITKSGTNQFHGDLYEFFRSDVLDANNFFNNRSGKARPPLRYNDFGGTIGGPLFIPHVYNEDRNKTFFFFSEEARRVITYSTFLASSPTANERAGTFPQSVCLNASCSQQGTQVTNIDPAAQAYLTDLINKEPLPDDPACVSGCTATTVGRNIFNLHQEILRIDHVFSPKLSIFGRFENDTIPTVEPGGLFRADPFPGVSTTNTNSPGRIFTLHAVVTFTPTLLNDAGYNYSHGGVISDPVGSEATKNSPDIVKAVTLPFTPTVTRVPDLSFSDFSSVNGFGSYRDFNDDHNVFDNLSKIMGRHTLKFGFTYNWYRKHENAGDGNQGAFSFSTFDPQSKTNSEFQEFANFLEGNVASFTQTSQDFTAIIVQQQAEFYAQDEFHFRPNLTFDYGIRYSLFRQPTDSGHHLTTFDPAAFDPAQAEQIDPCTGNLGIQTGTCANPNVLPPTGNPLDGIIIGGKNSPFGNAVSRNYNRAFAPRVGFAWDPFRSGKTSVRGGYGIYYDSPAVSWYEQAVFDNPPFVTSANIVNTTLDSPGGGTSTPSLGPPVLNGVSTAWKQPYTQEWSLDVQREVMPNLMVDIGYYGNKGTHLLGDVDINEPTPGAYVTALAPYGVTNPIQTFGATEQLNFIRPFRGYDAMNIFSTEFDSNYNGLQIAVQKRFKNNSLLNVNYTWSHALTDAQGDFTTPVETNNLHLDYGNAQFDRRHILNVNYVYYLPFFQAQNGLVGHVLGGWEVSGIVTAYSGLPLTSFDFNEDPAGIGVLGFSPATERPDLVGDPQKGAPHTVTDWFNKAAFAEVPAGLVRPGSAPRGAILGPGLQRWDLSLFKNTKINERFSTQFRAEAFNVFNHTNFNGVTTTFSSSRFGRVTSARDPRILQLALKLYF